MGGRRHLRLEAGPGGTCSACSTCWDCSAAPLRGVGERPQATRSQATDRSVKLPYSCVVPSYTRQSRKYLVQAPLALVVCGVSVPAILSIESRIAEIQDRLRKQGLPRFEKQQIQQLQFSGTGANVVSETRFLFSDRDKSIFAVISAGGVFIEALTYTGFENFLDALKPIAEAFDECVQPGFYERVGLRYVDRLTVGDPKDAYKYFDQRILSFDAETLGIDRMLINNHLQGAIGSDTLQLRLSQVENAPLLPLDLLAPEFQRDSLPAPGVHTFLDVDCSVNSTSDFNWENLERELWRLHGHTEKAFWSAITPEAESEWGLRQVGRGEVE